MIDFYTYMLQVSKDNSKFAFIKSYNKTEYLILPNVGNIQVMFGSMEFDYYYNQIMRFITMNGYESLMITKPIN